MEHDLKTIAKPIKNALDIVKKRNGDSKKDEPEKKTLIEWFDKPGKYPTIMNLLVEKGLCQPNTYVWIDKSPGLKTAIATLIKHLHAQEFYIDNISPSNEEIVLIAKETFGIMMKIDIVKKAKAPTSPNHNFSFIGPASTY